MILDLNLLLQAFRCEFVRFYCDELKERLYVVVGGFSVSYLYKTVQNILKYMRFSQVFHGSLFGLLKCDITRVVF